jgi:RNA polymerase sigma factor (sigma-70 family)
MEYPLRREDLHAREKIVNFFVLKKPEETAISQQEELGSFEALMLPHLDAAHNLARWLLRNELDAQDVVQEAYLRAFKSFHGFHGSDGRAWLLKIVRNTAYTWLSKNRSVELATFDEEIHSPASEESNPAVTLGRSEDARFIKEAMEDLPVAALVYQRRKHFINVFIWPIETGDGKATKAISRQGYQLLRWVDRDLTYWAVSDAASNELVALKELIERQTAPQP